MKSHYYSLQRKQSVFNNFGFKVIIEYRSRLNKYDLIFYPNLGTTYGNRQYFNKFTFRLDDYFEAVAIIIKANELYANNDFGYLTCLKIASSDYALSLALRNASTPAHSSVDMNNS